MSRRLHEHSAGADGGVCEWPAEEQVRGRVHPGQQRAVHQHAEAQDMKLDVVFSQ